MKLKEELNNCKTWASVVLKMFTFPFSQMRTIWLSNIGKWWCFRRDCPAIRPLFLVNLPIPIFKCRSWSTKTPRSVRIIHKKNSNLKFKNSNLKFKNSNFLQKFFKKIQIFLHFKKADWVYDPHVGFYVENDVLYGPASPYRPIYRCLARHPKGFEADTPVYVWQPFKPRNFLYRIIKFKILNWKIKIKLNFDGLVVSVESDVLIQMPARRILMDQQFQLNCSITYYQSQNLTVELHWMVPQLRGIDVNLNPSF